MENKQRRAWIDLRKLRKERGWIQADVADKLGVTREHISAIENGKRGISMQIMASIIREFGVKYEDFYQTLPESAQDNQQKSR